MQAAQPGDWTEEGEHDSLRGPRRFGDADLLRERGHRYRKLQQARHAAPTGDDLGATLLSGVTVLRLIQSTMAELVDDLQRLGIVERKPDPTDRRAKLICLTEQGWAAMRTGHQIIAGLEAEYAQQIGSERFDTMCHAMQALLDARTISHWENQATWATR